MSNVPTLAPPPAAASFDVIGKVTLTSAAVSITFSGIDTNNRMFRVTSFVVKDGTGGGLNLNLNANFADYDFQRLTASNTTTTASRVIGSTAMQLFAGTAIDPNETGLSVVYIGKQLAGVGAALLEDASWVEDSVAALILGGLSGIWGDTTQLINSIRLSTASGNLDIGTSVLVEGQFKGRPL